jgi:hypothetical protein
MKLSMLHNLNLYTTFKLKKINEPYDHQDKHTDTSSENMEQP